jgi:hypothetical protein
MELVHVDISSYNYVFDDEACSRISYFPFRHNIDFSDVINSEIDEISGQEPQDLGPAWTRGLIFILKFGID